MKLVDLDTCDADGGWDGTDSKQLFVGDQQTDHLFNNIYKTLIQISYLISYILWHTL